MNQLKILNTKIILDTWFVYSFSLHNLPFILWMVHLIRRFLVRCSPACLFLLLLPWLLVSIKKIIPILMLRSSLFIFSSRMFMVSDLIF